LLSFINDYVLKQDNILINNFFDKSLPELPAKFIKFMRKFAKIQIMTGNYGSQRFGVSERLGDILRNEYNVHDEKMVRLIQLWLSTASDTLFIHRASGRLLDVFKEYLDAMFALNVHFGGVPFYIDIIGLDKRHYVYPKVYQVYDKTVSKEQEFTLGDNSTRFRYSKVIPVEEEIIDFCGNVKVVYKINKSKFLNAILANSIHAFDSSFLVFVMEKVRQSADPELRNMSVAFIHDCIFVPAPLAPRVHKIVLACLSEMFYDEALFERFLLTNFDALIRPFDTSLADSLKAKAKDLLKTVDKYDAKKYKEVEEASNAFV
jgi:hypothetical protein